MTIHNQNAHKYIEDLAHEITNSAAHLTDLLSNCNYPGSTDAMPTEVIDNLLSAIDDAWGNIRSATESVEEALSPYLYGE